MLVVNELLAGKDSTIQDLLMLVVSELLAVKVTIAGSVDARS